MPGVRTPGISILCQTSLMTLWQFLSLQPILHKHAPFQPAHVPRQPPLIAKREKPPGFSLFCSCSILNILQGQQVLLTALFPLGAVIAVGLRMELM